MPKQCNFADTYMTVSIDYLKMVSGINNLKASDCCKLLNRMMLSATTTSDSDNIILINIPINRSGNEDSDVDIHSCCDVAEDLCIAYGYNNICKKKYPSGKSSPQSISKNELRKLMSLCQYKEVMMPILTAQKFEFGISNTSPVTLLNSNVQGIDIARTTLIPGLLKALNSAKRFPLPLRIFEVKIPITQIGDICLKNDASDVGVVNATRLAAAVTDSQTAGFEEIHGVLECAMNAMGFASRYQLDEFKMHNKLVPLSLTKVFDLKETSIPCFLDKRCVKVVKFEDGGEVEIGVMGVVHPNVLKEFDLTTPVSLLEIVL